jgi:formate hydrogenlyase subunit 3/multisubunit Na+/H+ antiporter MnhD subunit
LISWLATYSNPILIPLKVFLPYSTYFKIDLFSLFLSTLSISVGFFILFFNFAYPSNRKIPYYILFSLCEFGILGIAFSTDLFTLLVFWEIMSITSYFLITFGGRVDELVALKFIFISVVGAAIFFFSIALIFSQTYSLNFEIVRTFFEKSNQTLLKFLFVFSMICFAIEAGIVPFHQWVPDTYQEAYSPTSALFSSILTKVGFFGLIRLVVIFFPISQFIQLLFLALAFLTMFTGNFLALFEHDLKRIFAFSSIANIGYALFGFSIFTLDAWAGGIFHLINHAIVKALAFFIAGICFYLTGKKHLKDFSGLGRSNKVFGFSILVCILTLLGIPSFSVFDSEFLIGFAGIKQGMNLFVVLFLINIFLSLFYYLRILRYLFKKEKIRFKKQIPLTMQISILTLSLLSILLGIYPWHLIDFCYATAASLLGKIL